MIETCKHLSCKFNPSTIFTCSDEITLIFPALNNSTEVNDDDNKETKTFMYSGRIQKIVSIASSFTSVTFYNAIKNQCSNDPILLDFIDKNKPYFDARIHNVKNDVEVLENIIWRSNYDYRRNSIAMFAQKYLPKSELYKLSCKRAIELLKDKGYYWDELDPKYKFGTFIKKKIIEKTVIIKGETIMVERKVPIEINRQIKHINDENVNFLISKIIEKDNKIDL